MLRILFLSKINFNIFLLFPFYNIMQISSSIFQHPANVILAGPSQSGEFELLLRISLPVDFAVHVAVEFTIVKLIPHFLGEPDHL